MKGDKVIVGGYESEREFSSTSEDPAWKTDGYISSAFSGFVTALEGPPPVDEDGNRMLTKV